MTRAARWSIGVALALGGVAAALLAAFFWLVPDDRALALRIAAEVQQRYGVKLTIGNAHLTLWPSPRLTLREVAIPHERPISVNRLDAHLRASELMRRRVSIESIEIDGAVVPQLSLLVLLRPPKPADDAQPLALQQVRFRNLTWITRYQRELPLEGQVSFDTDSRLKHMELVRTGAQPPAQLTLSRAGPDSWNLNSEVGGGTSAGQLTLQTGKDGRLRLAGQLSSKDIELAAALAAFNARSPLRGKASGQTQLSASGDTLAALASSLQTRTSFTVSSATLLHIDIDKAIRSFGQDRSGQTALRSLSGRMDTRNTPDGMVVRYANLQAKGESFTASGEGTIARRRIDGKATVDLAGGLVGVPLTIAGPLSAPNVSVPTRALASAAAGAAAGTMVLPGVGTALGAKLGELFGRRK